MSSSKDIDDPSKQPRTKKVRRIRLHVSGILIPTWWRGRIAIGLAVIALASAVLTVNALRDAKDRLPDQPEENETAASPRLRTPAPLIPESEDVTHADTETTEEDTVPLAYEEALPADTIDMIPVMYPDADGPRYTVLEEFVPQTIHIEPKTPETPETETIPQAENGQRPDPEHDSHLNEDPSLAALPDNQSIDPALEEILAKISISQLGSTDETKSLPLWKSNALPFDFSEAGNAPLIAIVIDDMGVDRRRSEIVAEMQGPLTLAYLTYAKNLPDQTSRARSQGHELMLHVPMEPENRTVDPGPQALRVDDPVSNILDNLRWGLSRFDGYVGINNHMGSRFTQNETGMRAVLAEIRSRGLLFLDSRTAGGSAAPAAAREFKVPFITRNVFLDHVDDIQEIRGQLRETERLARKNGAAIAIGHPRDATIQALSTWLIDIEERGFVLAPISAIVARHGSVAKNLAETTSDQ